MMLLRRGLMQFLRQSLTLQSFRDVFFLYFPQFKSERVNLILEELLFLRELTFLLSQGYLDLFQLNQDTFRNLI